MGEIDIVLQRLEELRIDIKELFAKIDDKGQAISELGREIGEVRTNLSHYQQSTNKDVQSLWVAINEIRSKPDKSRATATQIVTIIGGVTGWIVLVLKAFGVLQ
jgi:uncharacterized coiled-coil DUF342 family protein